jgi:penicillin-binding protein 1A
MALAQSVNTVAARLADEVGRTNVAATAQRLGVASPVNVDPAMALGTTLVSPLELTQAYLPLANGGYRLPAYGIERIRTTGGKVLY